ncbi:hypothetical protein ACFV0B_11240 [Streptomyces xanthophaeus]|uniref:hypothetical protein n=1 Tax=Streptomyces xanthophaeus TaxID=67385 RepID=UPI0036B91C1C
MNNIDMNNIDRLIADARRALAALTDLIEYCDDPGSEALGARYCLAATLNAVDPGAQIPLPQQNPEASAVLRIVADWYEDANEGHGVDPSDLVGDLERAGFHLPAEADR